MPGGGVCAVLDYEVDMMADYISVMAVELAAPRTTVTAAFRKFCSQILSSTRLPKSTILLGMNYLSKRVNLEKMNGPFCPHEGQVWRMLIVALLLGSKFLDDNTFQNRSWSDVSGIAVAELNKLEAEWLASMQWNLFVNIEYSQDYNAWMESWTDWAARKNMAQTLVNRDRLASLVAPIQTDFTRPARVQSYDDWHQQQIAEYERLSSLKRIEQTRRFEFDRRTEQFKHFDTQHAFTFRQQEGWNQFSAGPWSNTPLTPPDSGYGTPEYPPSATSGSGPFYGDWLNRAFANNDTQTQPRFPSQNSAPNLYYPPRHVHYRPVFYNHGTNIWEMTFPECHCATCTGSVKIQQSHFMAGPSNYGQAVLG